MVFTDTIKGVLPNHYSLNGTYWGWQYRTNIPDAQGVPDPYIITEFSATSQKNRLLLSTVITSNFNNPSEPGTGGYRVYARRDPSIDFRVGSSIRARISSAAGHHVFSDSPVPGAMLGIEDSRGLFFGIGFGRTTVPAQRLVRIITNPFTGAGSEWIPIPVTSEYFQDPTNYGSVFDVELVIAGSRASILVSGRELKNESGNLLVIDAGARLTSLIFSQWINHGGVIVGDYSLTSTGFLQIESLSYY